MVELRTNLVNLIDQLIADEGLRLKPYTDTVGKLTIGVGRNLTDVGISKDEALQLLTNDITAVRKTIASALPWVASLDGARQDVVANMVFNMGITRFNGFHKFIDAMQAYNWESAASEMLTSLWAHQVGARAVRLAKVIRGE